MCAIHPPSCCRDLQMSGTSAWTKPSSQLTCPQGPVGLSSAPCELHEGRSTWLPHCTADKHHLSRHPSITLQPATHCNLHHTATCITLQPASHCTCTWPLSVELRGRSGSGTDEDVPDCSSGWLLPPSLAAAQTTRAARSCVTKMPHAESSWWGAQPAAGEPAAAVGSGPSPHQETALAWLKG